MAKTLSERITSAQSTDRINLKDLEQLIADATAERDRLSAAAVAASAASVDFGLTDHERDEAAAQSARYARTAQALAAPIAELTAKLEAKRNSDSQRAKAAEIAEIVAERDALADRLTREWPLIEARICELLADLAENDARIRAARISERSAEAVARGLAPDQHPGLGGITRLADLRLPSFADPRRLAWPIPDTVNFDHIRAARVAHRRALEAERARWTKVRVTPRDDMPPGATIRTDRGEIAPRGPLFAHLDEAGIAAARKAGFKVEIATADLRAGAVPDVAVLT